MFVKHRLKLGVVLGAAFFAAQLSAAVGPATTNLNAQRQRFIVVTKTGADPAALRAEIEQAGGSIVRELGQIRTFVVTGPPTLRSRIDASAFAAGIASDHIVRTGDPGNAGQFLNGAGTRPPHATHRRVGDPAFTLPGLLWNFDRIHAHEAWATTLGSPTIKVGVVDTGIDFTHTELASQVIGVVDFTVDENPPICKTFFGLSDDDWAALFDGPPLTDWNGHGTWIGGTIAAALNGSGMNGIAPRVSLVSLKVSQWCDAAYDSTILEAIMYAAENGIDVINISFGGYLDLSNRDERSEEHTSELQSLSRSRMPSSA